MSATATEPVLRNRHRTSCSHSESYLTMLTIGGPSCVGTTDQDSSQSGCIFRAQSVQIPWENSV